MYASLVINILRTEGTEKHKGLVRSVRNYIDNSGIRPYPVSEPGKITALRSPGAGEVERAPTGQMSDGTVLSRFSGGARQINLRPQFEVGFSEPAHLLDGTLIGEILGELHDYVDKLTVRLAR